MTNNAIDIKLTLAEEYEAQKSEMIAIRLNDYIEQWSFKATATMKSRMRIPDSNTYVTHVQLIITSKPIDIVVVKCFNEDGSSHSMSVTTPVFNTYTGGDLLFMHNSNPSYLPIPWPDDMTIKFFKSFFKLI